MTTEPLRESVVQEEVMVGADEEHGRFLNWGAHLDRGEDQRL